MQRVAIFGVGLIGGSFGLALREAGFGGELVGVSSPRTIQTAIAMGAIDRGVAWDEAASTCDLIYLSQPILAILDTLDRIGPLVREGTIVTDAGSTKRLIAERGASTIHRGMFLGGHPMAGKERSGIAEAEAGLFTGRTWVLTPSSADVLDRPDVKQFMSWVERIGARLISLDAVEHDRLVAYTSHTPQLLSTALAAVLAAAPGFTSVAGPGLQSLTRLASSPFNVWRDILLTNREPIEASLDAVIAKLNDFKQRLANDTLASEFEVASLTAAELRAAQSNTDSTAPISETDR